LALALGVLSILVTGVGPASAQKINCANEFRSGKLYFSQKILDKAVDRFALAVEACPEKPEYRGRYAIALAEYGGARLGDALVYIDDPEARQATIDSVEMMFTTAGAEFDSAAALDESKKNQKFVRENREHYWVERYNLGVKLLGEEDFEKAELQFRLARLIDSTPPKAYSQGAIALISIDHKSEAAALVQAGLEQAPDDERLNTLLESIYLDAAKGLTREAEEAAGGGDEAGAAAAVKKTEEAVEYLNKVLERRGGADADILFDRGAAKLAAGSLLQLSHEGEGIAPAAAAKFKESAADFEKSGELVKADEENRDFYLNTLFNQIQALINAEAYDPAMLKIKEYIALDAKDPAIWQMWAMGLVSKDDDSKRVMVALMASKSLAGEALDVVETAGAAVGDAAAALKANGNPDFIYTYQDASSQDQIETWFWVNKKTAMCFILGDKSGELTW
jgi:hypothetical protein